MQFLINFQVSGLVELVAMSVDAYLLKDRKVVFVKSTLDRGKVFTSHITIIPEDVSTIQSGALHWDLCNELRQSLAELKEDQR